VEGTERLPNGDVFEGSYDGNGERAHGTLRKRDCRVVSAKDGAWQGDTLLEGSDLRIVYRTGHVYCGDHSNSLPHGEFLLWCLGGFLRASLTCHRLPFISPYFLFLRNAA